MIAIFVCLSVCLSLFMSHNAPSGYFVIAQLFLLPLAPPTPTPETYLLPIRTCIKTPLFALSVCEVSVFPPVLVLVCCTFVISKLLSLC